MLGGLKTSVCVFASLFFKAFSVRGLETRFERRAMQAEAFKPPTIGKLRAMGLEGMWVHCARAGCGHSAALAFDRLGLPDDVPFPEISPRRRFTCSGCGAVASAVTPDWREYHASGMGKG